MLSKKVILIGDFSTGKTSLIRRYVDNQFSDRYLSTIGVKISRKKIDVKEEILQALIWDIEGGTKTKPVNKTYLIGAHGCIVVADITREDTIGHIALYLNEVQTIAPGIPFVIVLNKSDCLPEEEASAIQAKVLQTYKSYTQSVYVTSAKSGEGVMTAFTRLAMELAGQ